MAVKKMPIGKFVEEIYAAYKRKDGYIMSSTGQNPKKWAKTSWWFTQYDKKPEQKKKALYWRENAARVWDCQGLSEGLYKDYSGVDVNTKARYNYSTWCGTKGAGMIPGNKRIRGAAVFWGDDGKPSTIHHVGYLYKPVNSSKPEGDWYLIEARGVMYGVVMTKLESRKPNFWGYMTKYFDYSNTIPAAKSEPTVPEVIPVKGNCLNVRHGSYYVRTEPNASGTAISIVKTGDQIPFLGEVSNGWYKVEYKGKIGWISSKSGDIIENKEVTTEVITVKGGSWHIRENAAASSKSLGVVKAGTTLKKNGKTANGWVGVLYNGKDAWITAKAI